MKPGKRQHAALLFLVLPLIAGLCGAACARNPRRGPAEETLYPPLAAAVSGQTIELPPGRYPYYFHVPEGVTLRGAGPERTFLTAPAPGAEPIVKLASGATVEALAVDGGQIGMEADFANNFQIRRCAFRSSSEAALLVANGAGRVVDCQFAGNGKTPCGIHVRNAVLQIERSRFDRFSAGLLDEADLPSDLTIVDCQASADGDGLHLRGSKLTMRRTAFQSCADDALDLAGDVQASIEDCRFVGCADNGAEVGLRSSTRVAFVRCAFEKNGRNGLSLIYGGLAGPLRNSVRLVGCRLVGNRHWAIGLFDAQGRPNPNPAIRFPLVLAETSMENNAAGQLSPGTTEAPLGEK